MKQSRAEKLVAKALATLTIALVLWWLLKPEDRQRRRPIENQAVIEADAADSPARSREDSIESAATGTTETDPASSHDTAATPASGEPNAVSASRLSPEEIAKRRSAVKASLSAIYTSNASFFAEYNRYTTDLAAAGYMPIEGVLAAKYGFLSAYEPRGGREENENPARHSSDIFLNLQDEDGEPLYKYDDHTKDVDLSQYAKYCRDGCTATDSRFEVVAAFNLDEDDTMDVWIIDSNKEIRHVIDDTKE